MTFNEFLSAIGMKSYTFWGIIAFLMSLGIEFVPKIKWNPWTAIIKWIGSKFNSKLDAKIDIVREEIKTLDNKVNAVSSELNKHIEESQSKNLSDTRRDILDFCNSCMNKRRHTKEEFDFVVTQCDDYEIYIKKNEIKNGVIEAAIKEIRRLYEKCIQENDFLKEEAEQ